MDMDLTYPEGFDPEYKVVDSLGNMCYPEQKIDGFSDHVFRTKNRLCHVGVEDEDEQVLASELDSVVVPTQLTDMEKARIMLESATVLAGKKAIEQREIDRRQAIAHREQLIELAAQKAAQRDKQKRKFEQISTMINCIIRFISEYEQNGIPFRMEPFQLEILRGMTLGCAEKQLGHDLYKYKHLLLDMVGLASPAVARFNPEINNPRLLREVDKLFDYYNKCYMVATVPRRCGKTTIVSIVLGAMLSFMGIDIMVQAQNLNMANTIQKTVQDFMNHYKSKSWFPEKFKYKEVTGTCKNLVYHFNPGAKDKKTTAHYLASSGNSARGQNPDICVVDEAAFVGANLLVSVLPLMTVKGTKQIHISSPGSADSWISHVGDVRQENGETLAQIVDYKYKCKAHAEEDGISCVCNDIYKPDHIEIEAGVKELMNLVCEGAFEMELTGGHTLAVKPDNHPFETGALNFMLNTTQVNHAVFKQPLESLVVISVDPTWSTGTVSNIGVCTSVHTTHKGMPRMIIFGLDELDISNHVSYSSRLHELVLRTHILVSRLMFPELEIAVVIESNTFAESVSNLWTAISNWCLELGFTNVFAYIDSTKDVANPQPGKIVGRNKLQQFLGFADALRVYKVGRADVVFAVGQMVMNSFNRRLKHAEHSLNLKPSTQATGSLASQLLQKDAETFSETVCDGRDPEQLAFSIAQQLEVDALKVKELLFNYTGINLNKLLAQMKRVKVVSDANNQPMLDTGGKKRNAGTFDKDDILSAAFLNYLVLDEVSNPDNRLYPVRG
ncbi:DNA packaging terminase subunit 1 [Cyprinid herpesvirus 1]|uniref:Terminase n=1 Tax=Cyprinid herpesvirus 1 TaxID=317858 RepID=C6ER43_9VIRU|nr:DNA packaging terminase subunit 1 [Cyprinid herpesvirus 1]ACD84552.1 terminase [Cyprinid herpesvirus 1]AFJ20337.1 DNA packaging terminase subunit 1 [Cyprinid herpesvirus 1]